MAKNNKKTKVAITIFLITAIIVTALTAVLAFGEKNEGYRTITVIEIGGTVGVVHGNMEYAAYTGMHLEEGYTVVTNGNSYIRLLLDDDKYVKLESGTKAVFSEVSGGKTAIDIERGALVAEVTKPLQVDEDFIVNTPNAILAVRGTLFRVDLSRNDKGELNTDVMTYGGAVSSKRVQPSGEVEDIEVTIKEGFKATVNMDDKETVYLVDDVKVDLSDLVGKPSGDNKPGDITTETNANGDIIENTPITFENVLMPIVVEDIPDDDLVDIYFASENGHSMFIETKEIEEKIIERNIDVSAKTSVYEIAEKVKEPVEIVIPDDNKSLVTTTEPVTEAVVIQGPPTDGLGETTTEVTTETTTELVTTTEPTTVTTTKAPTTTVPSTTAPTTTVPATTAPTTTVPSTTAPTTTVPTTESTTVTTTQPTTEETTVHIHTETIEETKATCTETGLKTVKCSTCGEIISKTVLAATGHSEIFSGAKDAHTECSVCYEVLSTSHSYTKSTTNPSCTLDGGTTYVCECGYNYTDKISATGHTEKTTTVDATCKVDGKTTVSCSVCTETLSETVIPATGHTEENGSGADIHTKCSICGDTVKDGTYHNYSDVVITPNSCTTAGVLTRTCNCGWSYTEEIPAGHVKSTDGTTCSGCGGVWVDLNSDNFPDSMFLSYLSTTYDADGNSALIGDEVTGVVTINVSGNSTTDGGYTYLTGIKNFTNLVNVNCAYNSGITSLDLSGLTKLESLDVTGLTNLKTLNISGTALDENKIIGLDTCTALTEFNASGCTNIKVLNLNNNNRLETVNLNGCSSLTTFTMGDDSKQYFLSSINLTNCNNLETLEINNTSELKTFDFSDKTKIKSIDLGGCQGITYLAGLSGKTSLQFLDIAALNKITEIDVSSCSALNNISITACSSLQTINLGYSGVTTFNGSKTDINLSSYSNLKNVYLNNLSEDNNSFTTITLPTTNTLEVLSLAQNKNVVSLDLSGKTVLKELMLSDVPKLSSLNIADATALESLSLMNTGLTSLSVTGSSALTTLNVYNNTALVSFSLTGATQLDIAKLSAGTSNTALTSLSITSSGITSLDVTYLPNITSLDVSGCASLTSITGLDSLTNLTTLNVNGCTNLETVGTIPGSITDLTVYNSGLTTLDASACAELISIDVSGCTSLASLDVSDTKIETIYGLSGCSNLDTLVLDNLNIPESTNYSIESNYIKNISAKNLKVNYLSITSQSLKSLDITGSEIGDGTTAAFSLVNCSSTLETLTISNTNINMLPYDNFTALKTFKAENCTELTGITSTINNVETIDISGCTGITSSNINFSNYTELKTLDVGNTGITSIDVDQCTKLENLDLSGTGVTYFTPSAELQLLKSINLSNCDELQIVQLIPEQAYTELTSINVSGCDALTSFQLESCTTLEILNLSGLNNLESLVLTECTALTTLDVSSTKLTLLDLSDCTLIESVNITGSTLTVANITLPDGKDESIITGP